MVLTNRTNRLMAVTLVIFTVLMASCASTKVTRVSADTAIDLSGRWNDTDAQQTANAMIQDVLQRPWLTDFSTAQSRKPVVIVGDVRNRSSEHIDTSVFTTSLEQELINSGKVKFVASKAEREGIRDEKTDQQTSASSDTMKRLGQETGADFYLSGIINSITDSADGQRVVYYKVSLELTNIESNEKVWIGSKQIKKVIDQSQYKP